MVRRQVNMREIEPPLPLFSVLSQIVSKGLGGALKELDGLYHRGELGIAPSVDQPKQPDIRGALDSHR